jgi:hypothetical protein
LAVCLGYKPVPRDGAIIFADLIGKFDLLRGLGDVPEIPEHLKDGHLTTNEREWLRAFIQCNDARSAIPIAARTLRPAARKERARRVVTNLTLTTALLRN